MRGQAPHWEETFAKHVSDKVLVTWICKGLSNLNNKKIIQ